MTPKAQEKGGKDSDHYDAYDESGDWDDEDEV
jgi:hypothetical protein